MLIDIIQVNKRIYLSGTGKDAKKGDTCPPESKGKKNEKD